MKQPPGYEDPSTPGHVCHLQRSLYGLKQAPRAWFKRLHDFLLTAGFKSSKTDVSLFYYTSGIARVYLLVYVDDIIMMGNDGSPGFFLGIEAVSSTSGMFLSQRRYMTDLLGRSGMADCKHLTTPAAVTKATVPSAQLYDNSTQYRRIVGALQYLTFTRPDLSYAVNRLCDWAGCPVDRKSTSGFAVYLGDNLISWLSKKQRTVARSSTEAEYKALADVSAEVTWVVSLLRELGLHSGKPATLWCDNLRATYLCANPVFHARTKHWR
ncbi:PREDICTED: uncharacterized protein LOC109154046 [Ipomoea nil]|uniref:uncharacterized protein LOC109154046 n=1 Tax=Ipomoea nil TaxID=35883 RepID=UPI0009014145|nr:PREDICTED: uncharacterized protein LOC109154046 [Ipomoea nil]